MIRCRQISKTYPVGGGLTVLKNVDLNIGDNEYVGILGQSGSGKSTLLHIMGLLDQPTEGTVEFEGQDTSALGDNELSLLRGKRIGFVFQSFHLIPQLTVIENIELPLFYQRVPLSKRRERSEKCLADVWLKHRRDHTPNQLSGGECQRVAIARALVTAPSLILADEPTGNLDSKTGDEIVEIFSKLHSTGRTVVVVTHDLSVLKRVPRIVRISDGVIEEDSIR